MDPRSSLSRNPSSNIPQSNYNPNMASAYAMPSYQNNTHLPPINYPPQQMPGGNPNYMPYHRNELPRYNPAPSPVQQVPDRYNQASSQGPMSNFPPNSVLPQPHAQNQQQQQPPQQQQQQQQQPPQQQQQGQQQQQPMYGNQPGGRPVYPQPLAPAPPRSSMDTFGAGYGQPGDNRQPAWSGPESMPGMTGDVGRDPTRVHVVGSQGRRGILPSAPGRPPVMMNGTNGSPKSSAIPQKDADGKFPCPNCTKTYLHAKHLKRHMLRHTGDRPYMCVLCNDTFSRSDILKRHFQKCSVRRGNPTGASHLSNPAAHLKKSQAAAAKAAANASPSSATTPNSTTGMSSGPYTTTSMPGTSLPATTAGIGAGNMPYAMPANGQNEMQRPGQNQAMPDNSEQNSIDPNAPKNWAMHNARNNQIMYHSNPTSPDHFGMAGGSDEKANVMSNAHHVGDQWSQMPSFGNNEQYMNQMFTTPFDQNQNDAKKGYASHEGGSNGYYIPPTSLGADGTLGSPFWNLESSLADPLFNKVDRLVDFCLPLGLQESLQEQQNNFYLRSCLTADAIKHFVQLYSHYQGHFPWLHIPTFNLFNAYDGLILAIICAGAVYSDRISQGQVRTLILKVKNGIERTSRVWNRFIGGHALSGAHPTTTTDYEELQAILICQNLIVWHGGVEERSIALVENRKYTQLVRELNMMVLAPRGDAAFSYLHNLMPGEQADSSQWSWQSWLEQEKRSRLMFMAYLFDAALNLYFNCSPGFQASELKLPLPCDDAAWEASDAETCAKALGLRGSGPQSHVNMAGSLRLKQLEMHHAVAALHNATINIQPRTTNVYGKFILIHALLVQIWQLQQQRSYSTPGNSPTPYSSSYLPHSNIAKSIGFALTKWKQSWDDDLRLQYSSQTSTILPPKRSGFCRDGVHFYWLARALLQPNQIHDWQLPAEKRFRHIMSGLRQAREWSKTDGANRGEEPGSVADIDDNYETESLELDMRKLFRPLNHAYSSPLATTQSTPNGYR